VGRGVDETLGALATGEALEVGGEEPAVAGETDAGDAADVGRRDDAGEREQRVARVTRAVQGTSASTSRASDPSSPSAQVTISWPGSDGGSNGQQKRTRMTKG
jgi:hypothetical protein